VANASILEHRLISDGGSTESQASSRIRPAHEELAGGFELSIEILDLRFASRPSESVGARLHPLMQQSDRSLLNDCDWKARVSNVSNSSCIVLTDIFIS
jgi:hypothetical protein